MKGSEVFSTFCFLSSVLFGCETKQETVENKKVEIEILPPGELQEILSLGFDSIVGPTTNFGRIDNGIDSFEVDFWYESQPFNLEEWGRDILGGNNRSFKNEPTFQVASFRSLLETPIYVIPESSYTLLKIETAFKYKPIATKITRGSYSFPGEGGPIGKVTFFPVIFNEKRDHAILICTIYSDPEMGSGFAYFFQRIGKHWKMVAQKQMWIS